MRPPNPQFCEIAGRADWKQPCHVPGAPTHATRDDQRAALDAKARAR
jgi:hypothetical protein